MTTASQVRRMIEGGLKAEMGTGSLAHDVCCIYVVDKF
jgi:hypothetical protein